MKDVTYLVEEAMKDQTFVNKLLEAKTAEEAQMVFASEGIEFTLEEVKAIGAGLRAQGVEGELAEEDLVLVAGGWLGTVASVVGIISGVVGIVDFVGKRAGWWK